MALKPYLQLVRLPNVFTAAADSLAGWLLVGGALAAFERWLPLSAASMAIYAAGIALNDVFDYAIDVHERPGRPLPSGRISRRFAAWLGGILLALGPCLAALSGSWSSVAVALALVACVLGYNAGLKRTVLGPEVMGACRGLNLLLGMSQAADLGGPIGWLAAGSLACFVVGVTWISRSEAETSGIIGGIAAGMIPQNAAILGLMAVSWVVNLATGRAIREPIPSRMQSAVKTGVFSLVWLDVGLVAAVRGPLPALAVALLWVPAFFLGRWLYST